MEKERPSLRIPVIRGFARSIGRGRVAALPAPLPDFLAFQTRTRGIPGPDRLAAPTGVLM